MPLSSHAAPAQSLWQRISTSRHRQTSSKAASWQEMLVAACSIKFVSSFCTLTAGPLTVQSWCSCRPCVYRLGCNTQGMLLDCCSAVLRECVSSLLNTAT